MRKLMLSCAALTMALPSMAQAACPVATLIECQTYAYQTGACWVEQRANCEALIDAAYKAERASLVRRREVLVPKDLTDGLTKPVATKQGLSSTVTEAALTAKSQATVYARGSSSKYGGVVQKTHLYELSPTAFFPQTTAEALSTAVSSFSRTAVVPPEFVGQVPPFGYDPSMGCPNGSCNPNTPPPLLPPGTLLRWPLHPDVAAAIQQESGAPRVAVNTYARIVNDGPGADLISRAAKFVTDPRNRWQIDGPIVRSCEEYVWQRYFTFSRFEGRAARLGGDYEAAFNLAYRAGVPGISNQPVRDELGNTTFEFKFPAKSPKNSYFSWRWTSEENFAYPLSTHKDNKYPWFTTPSITPLLTKLGKGYDYWSWSWSSLRTEGQWYLTHYNVDQLEELDAKKYAFEQLVAKRRETYRNYLAEYRVLERQVKCPDPSGVGELFGRACTSTIPKAAELDARVTAELHALDALIHAALNEADAMGCLSETRNACDFSPRGFLRMLTQMVDVPREADFSRCVAVTGNNFGTGGRLASIESAGIPKAGISPRDYNANSVVLTQLFTDIATYISSVVKQFPVDPATGKPKLGASDSDEQSIGSGTFGAGYSYNVGWDLQGFGTGAKLSDANVHVWSRFKAHISVLGGKTNLLDAVAELKPSGKVQFTRDVHVRVLGLDLFTPLTGETPDLSWNVVVKGGVNKTLAEAYAIVVIVAVPVKLSAGVAGEVGFTANLHGEVKRFPDEDTTKDGLGIVAEGSAGPFLGLDGFASAAVELVIVRAGIKGELTILAMSLPMSLNVTAKRTTDGSFVLEGNTKMDMEMRALSGRIAIFLESIFGDTEYDLVNWPGLEMRQNIFDQRLEPVSLTDLNSAFAGVF